MADEGIMMEITVVDDSDRAGWLASVTRSGEIYMYTVALIEKSDDHESSPQHLPGSIQ